MKTLLKKCFRGAILVFAFLLSINSFSAALVTGNMKLWHPVIVTIDGPAVDESETTFRNYRLNVTFTKGAKSFVVPGYFAADGNAGETSATSGNKWRAIFTPDEVGTWSYTASLRKGTDIAISLVATAGTPDIGDGSTGTFTVTPSAANESGFFEKGKLNYVGEHYGQFAGNKEWYLKAGPGSPEDFFGYKDFDNTVDGPLHNTTTQKSDVFLKNLNGEALHYYTPHVGDWKTGDPTWKGGKGKAIIGVLNYLSSIGVNSLYMIPFTINDDSDNTWPWTTRDLRMSYDVSKLDQWDIVFSHMDKVGIAPLYYLCESDNSLLLDKGGMTLANPIYYREIVARFGYHLGMRFNLGEELKQTSAQQAAASKFIKDLDPYNIIVCGHGSHVRATQLGIYNGLLGAQSYDGPNYQLHEADNVDHLDLVMWREKSAAAGHKWIVANDESYQIDNSTTTKGEPRMLEYAWRTYMAGSEGIVQYTGYDMPVIADITLEDFRKIENTQKILVAAKNLFLKPEINPVIYQMKNENALVGNPGGNDAPFCLAKKGDTYIVYRTSTANQKPLNLTGVTGTFVIKWYDAKGGGNLQNGSIASVSGGGSVALGNPPTNPNGPWAIVITKETNLNNRVVSVAAAGCNGSTVSGGGTYALNASATVKATPATPGCIFVNWTENAKEVSTSPSYTFSVTDNRQLVANFKSDGTQQVTYTVVTTVSSTTRGKTEGDGSYVSGVNATVKAIANSCFQFVNWTENGAPVSTENPYVFPVSKDRDLVANFSTKLMNVIIEPVAGGTVTDPSYICGDEFISTAKSNATYKFDGWFVNDVFEQADSAIVINIGDEKAIKAKFSLIGSGNAITYLEGSTITYYAPGMNVATYDVAKNVSIGKATTAPVIDGKDDEQIWKTAPLFKGQTIGKGAAEELVSSTVDAQLSWKATWDATALYVIIKVKDDVQVWNDALKGWNIDALEFYVTKDAIVTAETGNNLARTTQAKVLWQNLYIASPVGRAIMEFRGTDNVALAGTKTAVDGTSAARSYDEASKTTTLEIRYEWAKILTGANAFTAVAQNDKIRIGLMFNDNDNATVDTRDHKVYYVEKAEPNSALAYKDFAVVTLKDVVIDGVSQRKAIDNLMIYPNPASGMVMFSKIINADFYNVTGQKVLSVINSSKADISSLSKGMYQVKASNGLNYKLVVN